MEPSGYFTSIPTVMQVLYLLIGIFLVIGTAPRSAEFPTGLTYRGIFVVRTLGFVLAVLGVLGLKGLSGPLYSFSGNVAFGIWFVILGSGKLNMTNRGSPAEKWIFMSIGIVLLSRTLGEAFWYIYNYV